MSDPETRDSSSLTNAHLLSQNSDAALLSIADCLPGLIASVDCNMKLTYCNQLFRNWFAVDKRVSGLSFPTLTGTRLFNQVQRHLGHVLVGETVKFLAAVDDLGQATHYLDISLSPQFDQKKRVMGFVFHAIDTTGKVEMERGLSDYFENASICLHWVNEKGIIVWANPTELKTLGYSEAEYVGRHISEFHAKQPVIDDILRRLSNKEVLRNVEADLLCRDGSIKHVVINSSVFSENDKFIHTRCFTIDITEQKRAVDVIKQSEERFRQMANMVPLVIWTTDKNCYCNFLSHRWVETTGKPITDGLHEGWIDSIHPDDREKIRRSWYDSAKSRKSFEAKMRLAKSEGSYVATYINGQPQFNVAGEFDGYIGILQDISSEEEVKGALEHIVLARTRELRLTNERLSKATDALQEKNEELNSTNRQLSSFAHIASHDLQEPLRKIQILSSLLHTIEGSKFSKKGHDLYNRITDSSNRMRALIQDLLAYARNGKSNADFEYVDMGGVVSDVVTELDLRIAQKKAVISVHKLPGVHGIKFQVHQLFLNLISNALKFAQHDIPPSIEIRSEVTDGANVPGLTSYPTYYNKITVMDNGIGFDQEYAGKIFEMFKRLHTNQKYEGTGIGLAICKKISENHGGTIVAESREGHGATFNIYLPVATAGRSNEKLND